MSKKRSRALRRIFAQPNDFNLLDVPEDRPSVPEDAASTPTSPRGQAAADPQVPPDTTPSPDDSAASPTSLNDPRDAEVTPTAMGPDGQAPAPAHVVGGDGAPRDTEPRPAHSILHESPTEPLPVPTAAPTPPAPRRHADRGVPPRAAEPLRAAPQIRRKPRAPGALRGFSPAEKGEQLLRRVRAGESIHDHSFFDAALPGASLYGADLSCGQLQRVNFSGADLRGADLQESDLRGADLSMADLRGADLRGCRLELVRLEGADLRQANLSDLVLATSGLMSRADLRGADLSGTELSATMSGARINHHTYMASGWTPAHIAQAHQLGMLIDELERFPRLARAEVLGIEAGMLLQFSTPLTFQDRFVLQGMICAVLGPDCDCHLDTLSGNRLLLTTSQQTNLAVLAEHLSSRAWEQAGSEREESALLSQLERLLPGDVLRNELSALTDRLTSITLHRSGETMDWRPSIEPLDALRHLLLKLFIPIELRWWLAVLPGGKSIVHGLPEQEAAPKVIVRAALFALTERDLIDAALFCSLIAERQRQEAEIRAVAALWGVDLR